jgi:hypothetical protein
MCFSCRARRRLRLLDARPRAVGAIFWGGDVLYGTVLSVLALVPNFSTETPVETE